MKYGLTELQFLTLLDLVISPLKACGATVWIFGSRARGDHKPFSDVDILYETQNNRPFPVGFISKLKETIEESRFPFKVDLVNLKEIADSYREGALKDILEL